MLGDVNNFFVFKILLTTSSNVLPLHLKQTFLPIIWIFTEGEGDVIESGLPFKSFSTLAFCLWKEMAYMTFLTIIANFFTLIFFRFNMFIWRSIMSYVNAVLIKISVLNSTMTTASTSKFHFPLHFIYLRAQPDIFEH